MICDKCQETIEGFENANSFDDQDCFGEAFCNTCVHIAYKEDPASCSNCNYEIPDYIEYFNNNGLCKDCEKEDRDNGYF